MKLGRVIAAALGVGGMLVAAAVQAAPDDARSVRGHQLYERCLACHAIEANRTGPQHCGLFGRRAGTAPGYDAYSAAMRNSKIVWNERTLDKFLQDPLKAVPNTTMTYAGVKDPQERADLIAWLREATRPGQSCRLSR
jgi:cytochrome c